MVSATRIPQNVEGSLHGSAFTHASSSSRFLTLSGDTDPRSERALDMVIQHDLGWHFLMVFARLELASQMGLATIGEAFALSSEKTLALHLDPFRELINEIMIAPAVLSIYLTNYGEEIPGGESINSVITEFKRLLEGAHRCRAYISKHLRIVDAKSLIRPDWLLPGMDALIRVCEDLGIAQSKGNASVSRPSDFGASLADVQILLGSILAQSPYADGSGLIEHADMMREHAL